MVPTLINTLQLDGTEVRIWHYDLSVPSNATLLSPDEHARAARLVIPDKRRRFIAARVGLRLLLGGVTNRPPEALAFGYGADGKPYLVDAPWCEFNLAHSADFALVAVAGRAVGVDIEQFRALPSWSEMAQIAFSAQEQAELHALPVEQRVTAFFRTWTRKEALMKAQGGGFKLAKTFSLPVNDTAEIIRLDGWSIYDLTLPDNMIAAIALKTGDAPLGIIDSDKSL